MPPDGILAAIFQKLEAILAALEEFARGQRTRLARIEQIARLDMAMSSMVWSHEQKIKAAETRERDTWKTWAFVLAVFGGVFLGAAFGAWLWFRK